MPKKPRNRNNKRKKSSEGDSNEQKVAKHDESNSSQGVSDFSSVSEVLSQTNSILYDPGTPSKFNTNYPSVFASPVAPGESDRTQISSENKPSQSTPLPTKMADTVNKGSETRGSGSSRESDGPSNADLMCCLRKIDGKISEMDKRLCTLESLEKKVEIFDADMKKMWLHLDKLNKSTIERMDKTDDRLSAAELSLGITESRLQQMEEENTKLKENLIYLQSQSMRNNLIFGNIPESQFEKNEETESKLRNFLHEKLKIARETADSLKLERVHRMGTYKSGVNRKIVCKFNLFTDREMIRKQRRNLEGSDYFLHEQFPPEIMEKRRKLVPKLKAAINSGQRAWLVYDKLYVNGSPVRD